MYDLVIKNGRVVTAADDFYADIGVKDGKICSFLSPGSGAQADRLIDASGNYVLPGAIDVHTHFALPFGGTVSSDDYRTGSMAAACGGTTMYIDYATPPVGGSLLDFAKERTAMAAADTCIDFGFHMVLNDPCGQALKQLPALIEYGITSFKVYTVYEGMMVDDKFFCQLLEESKKIGGLVCVHAENKDMIDFYTERYRKEGKLSPWWHYMSRREFIEAEADKRCIHWAKAFDAPLYIVHLANKEGVEEVRRAKQEGYDILAETNSLYLRYNCEVYKREDARNFVCSPPIKAEASRLALWEGLQNGVIDTIATDHCPFQQAEKDWGIEDFTKIPNGCGGVENRYPYLLDAANRGRITFQKAVEVCCKNPAAIFGCYPQKGDIRIGSDADLVIYNPEKKVTISRDILHSNADHTVWEGTGLTGYPVMTLSRGETVCEDGRFCGKAGYGHYVRRRPYAERGAGRTR